MINISIKSFIDTLSNIVTSSASSLLFIVLGIIFTVAMIVNIKKKNTIGKSLFIIGWIFIISFIVIRYNNYLSKVFDNLINSIFKQIFFPNLAVYVLIIIVTNFMFLYSIFNNKFKTSDKIINSVFFSIIMVLMVYTLDQIMVSKVNVYDAKEVYTNKNILTLIESTTLIFTLWLFIIFSKFCLSKLIQKSNKKIEKEYEVLEEKSSLETNKISTIEENTSSIETQPNDVKTSDNILPPSDNLPLTTMQNINNANQTVIETSPAFDASSQLRIDGQNAVNNINNITETPTTSESVSYNDEKDVIVKIPTNVAEPINNIVEIPINMDNPNNLKETDGKNVHAQIPTIVPNLDIKNEVSDKEEIEVLDI